MASALREERERRGWTLDFIAKRVGVSSAQISRIENEGVRSAKTAKAISELFGNLTLEQVCFQPSTQATGADAMEVL